MEIPNYLYIINNKNCQKMKNQKSYVQKIEEFTTMPEAKRGIAAHFHTTHKNITLKDGADNEWWIYEGCVLRPDYKLIKDEGVYELIMNNGDFRYS